MRVNRYEDDQDKCLVYESLPLTNPTCTSSADASLVPRTYYAVGRDVLMPASVSSVSRSNPSYTTQYMSDGAAHEFVRTHCGADAGVAYSCLLAPSYRADLFRFCALYAKGGVYLDVDIVPLVPLEELYSPCSVATVGHDYPHYLDLPSKQMKILAGAPGAPIFGCAMSRIVANVARRYVPKTPLDLTGPLLLQSCYEDHASNVSITYIDARGAAAPYSGMRAGKRMLAHEISQVRNASEPAVAHYSELFAAGLVYTKTCGLGATAPR